MTIDTSRFKIPDREETRVSRPELPFKVFPAARQDRIAQLIQLLNDAIVQGDDDLAQDVRSDLFREYGLTFNKGGMMNINYMTRPVGYRYGTRKGELVGDKEFEREVKVFELPKGSGVFYKMGSDNKMIKILDPSGRITDKDREFAAKRLSGADILDPSGRITDKDREFAAKLTGVPERENVDTTAMRNMLESWMIKNPDQRISDRDIASMAIDLARDMAGGSSNENVNMAIDRLNALLPSVQEKVRVENTDLFTRGMQGLYSLLRPSKNRGVGFERVR